VTPVSQVRAALLPRLAEARDGLWHGFRQPFEVLVAAWREPAVRRQYLGLLTVRLALVVAAAQGLFWDDDGEPTFSWAWLLAVVAVVKTSEAVVVVLSHQWDDWLGYSLSLALGLSPESATAVRPGLELSWYAAPLRAYLGVWTRVSRSFDAPAAIFERAPTPSSGWPWPARCWRSLGCTWRPARSSRWRRVG
jgi:hypothetical protein